MHLAPRNHAEVHSHRSRIVASTEHQARREAQLYTTPRAVPPDPNPIIASRSTRICRAHQVHARCWRSRPRRGTTHGAAIIHWSRRSRLRRKTDDATRTRSARGSTMIHDDTTLDAVYITRATRGSATPPARFRARTCNAIVSSSPARWTILVAGPTPAAPSHRIALIAL